MPQEDNPKKEMTFWHQAVFIAHFKRSIMKTDETLWYIEDGKETFGVVLDLQQGPGAPLPHGCKTVWKPISNSLGSITRR